MKLAVWIPLIAFVACVILTGQTAAENLNSSLLASTNTTHSDDSERNLAPSTDTQVRTMRIKQAGDTIKGELTTPTPSDRVKLLKALEHTEAEMREYLRTFAEKANMVREEMLNLRRMVDNLGSATSSNTNSAMIAVLGVIGGAMGVVLLVRRALDIVIRKQCAPDTPLPLQRLRVFLAGVVFHVLSLGAWFCSYAVLMLVFIPDHSIQRTLANILFGTLTYAMVLQIFAMLLLSPAHAQGRLLPLDDVSAKSLYAWLMSTTLAVMFLAQLSLILENILGAFTLGIFVHASAGLLTGIILSALILQNRHRVARALESDHGAPSAIQTVFARHWHYPALAYASLVGIVWSVRALSVDESLLRLTLNMFIIPVFISVDLWCSRLLAFVSEDPPFAQSENDTQHTSAISSGPDKRSSVITEYFPLIRRTLRLVFVLASVFLMLRIWDVRMPMGWLFARNILGLLLVVMASVIFWEIVRVQIDRKLREEVALSGLDPDEMDEGGSGGSRTATLLVLLRKFVLTVVVVLGGLTALSSLGVDIAPLIAGAGVFGLAIGFGAQTLVKDIISGVFFLIDDAFRVGDYVEAGAAKGTVEQISLRSMKLRHPRGMVFNVPYGSLKILQNFSRDYIISKLDFRIRYDADIDKIRKIIKKINKEMQVNDLYNNVLLDDIKSNGVRGMEDSAMILRVKFKSLPGHQFVLQKEVYRRVQEAFRAHGIEFAHRNVTVFLPPEVRALMAKEAENSHPVTTAAIGGAAASAMLLIEEEQARAAAAAQAANAKENSE